MGERDGWSEVADLRVRGKRHGDSSRVHRIQRQFQLHSLPVPPEASRHQQQVHLQLRRPHLQLPRRQWLQYLMLLISSRSSYTELDSVAELAGRQVPIAFLERVKDDFVAKYGGGKAATAAANSLNKEFGSKLKEHMQYCVDHPEEISKLAKVKAQVSEVKGVMMENIEKVLDRGEKIELLVDKTETLHHQAQDFRNVGTKMRRKMWLQNMKVKLIVLGILIALILIIILSVCNGFNCGKN